MINKNQIYGQKKEPLLVAPLMVCRTESEVRLEHLHDL